MVKAKQKDYDEALADFDQVAACDVDFLMEPEKRRLFYDAKEGIARAAERARVQLEMDQLLEASEEEREEQKRRAEVAERELYQSLAQIEHLTKALADREQITTDTPLHLEAIRVQYYIDTQGWNPYVEWYGRLSRQAQQRLQNAIAQMSNSHFSNDKKLRAVPGVREHRLDSGLRIYYAITDEGIYSHIAWRRQVDQQRDIELAAARLADWQDRHPE